MRSIFCAIIQLHIYPLKFMQGCGRLWFAQAGGFSVYNPRGLCYSICTGW